MGTQKTSQKNCLPRHLCAIIYKCSLVGDGYRSYVKISPDEWTEAWPDARDYILETFKKKL
jgi:hypothetical protein